MVTILTYTHAYMHTYIHSVWAWKPKSREIYLHIHMHTYKHTYIHTYIVCGLGNRRAER